MGILSYAFGAVRSARLRSALTLLGIAIGIAAVTLLTAIGTGVRSYIVGQFTQFGSNVLAINPGKMDTWGVPGMLGGTTRRLTLEDARAVRRVPGVRRVVPFCGGVATVKQGNRARDVYVYGVTADVPEVWRMDVRTGRFLTPTDWDRAPPECVLGSKLARELFGTANPLGRRIRIGNHRFVVVGIMEHKGRFLTFDLDDTAYIPVSRGMRIFDRYELHEIDVQTSNVESTDAIAERVRAAMIDRHEGDEDFTLTTQTDALDTLDRILNVIEGAITGIAGISLFVGGIGVLTVMWICVHERRHEIGLVKALGARRGQILLQYLAESAMLAVAGGAAGVGAGLGGAALIHTFVPAVPMEVSPGMVVAGLGVSAVVGLLAGIAPARRAVSLDPITALRTE